VSERIQATKVWCEVCGYKAESISENRAYKTAEAHHQGQHKARLNWFPIEQGGEKKK